MDTAAAPVSLKGTREPLLLIATGLFLSSFWLPITGVLGFAGIALGMHDLRKSAAARTLGPLRVQLAIASWCACAFWASYFLTDQLLIPEALVQQLTLCATGIALGKLARSDGATGLARAFFVLAWTPLALLPLLALRYPGIAMAVYAPGLLALSILCLRLHARAAPYGRHHLRSRRA